MLKIITVSIKMKMSNIRNNLLYIFPIIRNFIILLISKGLTSTHWHIANNYMAFSFVYFLRTVIKDHHGDWKMMVKGSVYG